MQERLRELTPREIQSEKTLIAIDSHIENSGGPLADVLSLNIDGRKVSVLGNKVEIEKLKSKDFIDFCGRVLSFIDQKRFEVMPQRMGEGLCYTVADQLNEYLMHDPGVKESEIFRISLAKNNLFSGIPYQDHVVNTVNTVGGQWLSIDLTAKHDLDGNQGNYEVLMMVADSEGQLYRGIENFYVADPTI